MKVVKKRQLEKRTHFLNLAASLKRLPASPTLSDLIRPCPTNGKVFFREGRQNGEKDHVLPFFPKKGLQKPENTSWLILVAQHIADV